MINSIDEIISSIRKGKWSLSWMMRIERMRVI